MGARKPGLTVFEDMIIYNQALQINKTKLRDQAS